MISFHCRAIEVDLSTTGCYKKRVSGQIETEVEITGLSTDGIHQLHSLVGRVLLLDNVSGSVRPDGQMELTFKLRVGPERQLSWHEELRNDLLSQERSTPPAP